MQPRKRGRTAKEISQIKAAAKAAAKKKFKDEEHTVGADFADFFFFCPNSKKRYEFVQASTHFSRLLAMSSKKKGLERPETFEDLFINQLDWHQQLWLLHNHSSFYGFESLLKHVSNLIPHTF